MEFERADIVDKRVTSRYQIVGSETPFEAVSAKLTSRIGVPGVHVRVQLAVVKATGARVMLFLAHREPATLLGPTSGRVYEAPVSDYTHHRDRLFEDIEAWVKLEFT